MRVGNRIRAAVVAMALITAGCGQEEPAATKDGSAQGEVLPGSVSDAMLPLDSVRSQAPLAQSSGSAAPEGAPSAAASADVRPAAE